jgi:hypothetical protein
MTYSTVPYDYLRIRVQDKSTLAWTEILADGIFVLPGLICHLFLLC